MKHYYYKKRFKIFYRSIPLSQKMVQARPILGYWTLRAGDRGAVNRHILTYAGVDFEDKRYDFLNAPT